MVDKYHSGSIEDVRWQQPPADGVNDLHPYNLAFSGILDNRQLYISMSQT
jgi:hypothetical protein